MLGTGSKVILSESIQLLSTDFHCFTSPLGMRKAPSKRSFHKDLYSFTRRKKHASNYTGHRMREASLHRAQNEALLHRTQNEGWLWEEEPVSHQEPELNPERF